MMSIDPSLVPYKTLFDSTPIPAVGLGTFGSDHADENDVAQMVYEAARAGYRLFDCAAVYGNEPQIGEVFQRLFQEHVVERSDITVISKVWNDMHGKGDVLLSCARTLRDLRIEYLDLYLVHWPFRNTHLAGCDGDARNPDARPFSIDDYVETWRQMEDLVKRGLVKQIGMSNMTLPKLKAVLPKCGIKPAAMEMELHPGFQQQELFAFCVANEILPIGYCPLGSPARPDRDKAPGDVAPTGMPVIRNIAHAHGVSPAAVCLQWAVQRGQVPIPFSMHHYVENLSCVLDGLLSDAEMAAIADADANCRLIKGQVFLWEGAKGWEDLWDMDGVITR